MYFDKCLTHNFVIHRLSVLLITAMLTACASSVPVPDAQATLKASAVKAPDAWQVSLPHGGSAASMTQWWTQWGDTLLIELMEAAQKQSATLAAARSRISQARAALTGTQASTLPSLNASAQGQRGVASPGTPVASSTSAGMQASWEIDLFGGTRANSRAAQERLGIAQLGWHEARVAVAAEMATLYYSLRYCDSATAVTRNDAASRNENARLAELTVKAGLNAPANAALARASAADGANSVRSAQAQCDVLVKSIVALSAMPEPELRQKLQQNMATVQAMNAQTAMFFVANLPAKVLQQRPDIAAAQRTVAAASADAYAANAKRLPMLSLSGSIGNTSVRQMGMTTNGSTWSLGPIALTLPLLDGGRNRANTEAAVAAYDEAVVALGAKARNAVREVEEALVNLDSAAQRRADAQAAAKGYQASLDAAQARYKAGLASLIELEDARRTALLAQQNTLSLERDRIAAWINLYRAAGGGWTPEAAPPADQPSRSPP